MQLPGTAHDWRRALYGALGGAALATLTVHAMAARVDFDLITLFALVLGLAATGAFVAGGGLRFVAVGVRRIAVRATRRPRLLMTIGVILTATAVVAIFAPRYRFGVTTPIRFRKTTEPQTAVFATASGWSGLGGGAPVLDKDRRPIRLNGRTVVLDKDVLEKILRDKGWPGRGRDPERIVIKAQVHLEPCTRRGGSQPLPTGGVGRPRIDCYALVIDELIDVAWDGGRPE